MDMVAIGQRIKETRKKNQMTIAQLCEELNINDNYWYGIEQGRVKIGLVTLIKFLNIFKVSANSILLGSDIPQEQECINALKPFQTDIHKLTPNELKNLSDIISTYISNVGKQN